MALKTFNPVTPSQRQLVIVDRAGLHRGAPVKTLTEGKHSSGGRNNNGRTTVRFRGGGHKKTYRIVDFKRRKFDAPATVDRIEYDPNRTAFIALIKYQDGEQAYILAPQRLSAGDTVVAGEHVDVKPGNAMPRRQHSGRHHRPQHRAQDRQGRTDCPFRRYLCADRRPRRRLRHRSSQFRRATAGEWPLHGHDRRGVEPRQHEHVDRQSRS